MRRIRKQFSYANVMASIAILMSLGGTAYAAVVITGKNVKDSTLTGVDVKNYSLATADLSSATRASFKGPAGATGPAGIRGSQGPVGPKGDTGPQGAAAQVVTSFASRDTGFVVRNNLSPPNPTGRAWYDYNCNGANNSVGPCAGSDGNTTNAGVGQIELIADGEPVLALQGMSRDAALEPNHTISTANNIIVPWNSNLTGMSSVSLLHRGSIHQRAECAVQYANSATPGEFLPLGEPQMISSYQDSEIVSMTLVGSKNVSAGTYNVRVVCFDRDSNGTAAWRFIRGNLTAMAARNG